MIDSRRASPHHASTLLVALCSTLAACASEVASGQTDTGPEILVPDVATPDASPEVATDTQVDTTPADIAETRPDSTALDAAYDSDSSTDSTDTSDASDTPDTAETNPLDTTDTTDTTDTNEVADTSEPGPVTVSRKHWRLTFEDEFKGPQGAPSDDYCFSELPPQCHIWPGGSHHCDQSDVQGEGFYPPLRTNLLQALGLFSPPGELTSKTTPELRQLYGQLIRDRLADLDKCSWTLYTTVNWMATDYQGRWSARFDATQVAVDSRGKGRLELYATRAPLEASCIFGGSGGDPNCQILGFPAGHLKVGVTYWVDPDPRWAGVYYAPTGGACPHGGTFTGINCIVHSFAPNQLEARGVAYWADADPRWPGVYYANQKFACRDNIDYSPNLAFRNLTCPILNGGMMSYIMENRPYTGPEGPRPRGFEQHRGRFEVKAKIPKGIGAFPAAWLMPKSGGWPYEGGEIDVVEARDNADEVYQTYHHGRCYLASTGAEIDATDSADCATKGGVTTHLSMGFTTDQRTNDEFWKRDHLFAVEWTQTAAGDRLDYYINNVGIGTIEPGTIGRIDAGAPAYLATFAASNFPTTPFYWILNHSTYVSPDNQATFQQQRFEIDYVRNFAECGTDHAEYCPDGGQFTEGLGCLRDGRYYPSPCEPALRECVSGGTRDGARCRVWRFEQNQLVAGVSYWVDADPRWRGVFYNKVNGGCPHGGSGVVNCQLLGFTDDLLEAGVSYTVDVANAGVFYTPDFR